jgi:hypothetical protein
VLSPAGEKWRLIDSVMSIPQMHGSPGNDPGAGQQTRDAAADDYDISHGLDKKPNGIHPEAESIVFGEKRDQERDNTPKSCRRHRTPGKHQKPAT